jgi:hypothetical protein
MRGDKSNRVRAILAQSNMCAADIAMEAGVSYQLVTALRRKMRLRYDGDTVARRVAILEQEVRDLRKRLQRAGI